MSFATSHTDGFEFVKQTITAGGSTEDVLVLKVRPGGSKDFHPGLIATILITHEGYSVWLYQDTVEDLICDIEGYGHANGAAQHFDTELKARAFALGFAMSNDAVLVGHPHKTTSCRHLVSAFAEGLQNGSDQIGPGGPLFFPLTFPDTAGVF